MRIADGDPALRRFERDAVAACLAMAAGGFVAVAFGRGPGDAARAALGVIGGGLLVGFSYRAIKGAANLLVGIAAGPPRVGRTSGSGVTSGSADRSEPPILSAGRRAFLAVKFFTRYALLAVAAYVMLTCFRLHPVGLLAGATSPFVAALMQAARLFRAGRQHP